MPNSDLIRGGTASIAAGAVAVTGQLVSWSNVLEGDFFGAHVGLSIPIAAINGATLTLAYPWPGPTQNAAPYAIQPKGDAVRFAAAVRELLLQLTDGDLAAIAALPTAADTFAYFTGPGTAALTGLPAAARNFLANFTWPVARSGGVGMVDRVVRAGWNGAALLGQVDTLELGKIWTDSLGSAPIVNANAGYTKLPNGLILQWGHFTPASGNENRNFPIAFPTLVLGVYLTPNGGSADNVAITQFGTELNLSTFAVRTRRISAGAVDAISFPVSWFAIGA